MDELISPSHALNDPIVSGSQTGPELYKRRVVEFTASFPDLRFTIEDMIAEKGKVVACWTFSGTHKKASSWTFPPLAGKYPWRESRFTTSRTGRFSNSYARWDALGLLRQLGDVCVETVDCGGEILDDP